MFLTYIIRRELVKVSPKRGDPPQFCYKPPSNETILHGSTLKYDSVQDSEIAISKMTFCKIQIGQFARFKDNSKRLWYMIVYEVQIWYSLQDIYGRVAICKIWVWM